MENRKIILIVDDTPENLQVLGDLLNVEYDVRVATSGQDAIDIVNYLIPDLILLDIMMPDMNGYEVCHKLKEDIKFKNVPVIFISALGETENKIKAFQEGGVDYITKPFQIEEVIARVHTHIELSKLEILKREIAERICVEKKLNERVKELQAFFRLSEITEKKDISLEQIFQEFINILPKSWRYPEIACAKLVIGKKEFCSNNFIDTQWNQTASIKVFGAVKGYLEVAYFENEFIINDDPFLEEEKILIVALAERIGRITERMKSDELLRESENMNKTLIKHLPLKIFIKDIKSNYLMCNDNYARDLGINPEKIKGKNDFNFYPEDLASKYIEDDQEIIKTGIPKNIEEKYISEGKEKWIHTIKVPYLDDNKNITGVFGVFEDITENKNAEIKINNLHYQNELILNSTAEGILGLDLNGCHTFINKSAMNLLGYENNEILGHSGHDIWHHTKSNGKSYPKEECEICAAFVDGNVHSSSDEVFWRKDGSCFPVEYSSTPIYEHDEIVGVVVTFLDITKRKEMENKINKNLKKMQALYSIAELTSGEDFIQDQIFQEFANIMLASLQFPETSGIKILINNNEYKTSNFREYQFIDSIPIKVKGNVTGGIMVSYPENISKFIERSMLEGDSLLINTFAEYLGNIIERKQIENALKESEKLMRKISENYPNSYLSIINSDFTVGFSSGQEFKNQGLDPATFIGLNLEDVFGDYASFVRGYYKQTFKGEETSFELFINNQHQFYRTVPLFAEDGSIPKILTVVENITERRRDENLHASRAKLLWYANSHSLDDLLEETLNEVESLTGSTIGFYHFVDMDQKALTLQNWSTRTKNEFCKAEGKGSHYEISKAGVWVDCINQKKPVVHNDYASLINKKGLPEGHATIIRELVVPVQRAENIVAILGVGNKPIDYNEQDIKIVSHFADLAWDIAERKRSEEEITESNRKLQETLKKLKETQNQVLQQEKLRSLGQLASGVAHDINNSLTPIMGYMDILTDDKELMKRNAKFIEMIIKSAKNIARTIGRLKEFYKVKLTDDDLIELDIHKIINSAIELTSHKWKNMAQSTGAVIEIKKDFDENLSKTRVDESEIIEALTNLILNACDAMPDGGSLSFKTFQYDHSIVIQIKDTGFGMNEETLKHCIDPFFTTKGEKGTGLGLAMVYGVIERHKGNIEINSEPNKGTNISLKIPINKEIEEKRAITLNKSIKPLKILCVEDDTLINDMLNKMLGYQGHKVIQAPDGKMAFDIYQKCLGSTEKFDLVITDLGMPGLDGFMLSKLIKEISPNIPIILLTGWGSLINIDDYPTIDYLLRKPIMRDDLSKAIYELFTEVEVKNKIS